MNFRGLCWSWKVSCIDVAVVRVLLVRVCCVRVCVLEEEREVVVKVRIGRFFTRAGRCM